jgi:hypothetical protein
MTFHIATYSETVRLPTAGLSNRGSSRGVLTGTERA